MNSLYSERELSTALNEIKRTKKGMSILYSLGGVSTRIGGVPTRYFAHTKSYDEGKFHSIRFGHIAHQSLQVWHAGLVVAPFGIDGLVLLCCHGYYKSYDVKSLPAEAHVELALDAKYDLFVKTIKSSDQYAHHLGYADSLFKPSGDYSTQFGHPNMYATKTSVGFLKVEDSWVQLGATDRVGDILLGVVETQYKGSTPAAVVEHSSGGSMWLRGFLEHSGYLSDVKNFVFGEDQKIGVHFAPEDTGDVYNAAGAKYLLSCMGEGTLKQLGV